MTRGVDGLARLGGMGPQIASLVRHSENVIKVTSRPLCATTIVSEDFERRNCDGFVKATEKGGPPPHPDGGVGVGRQACVRGVSATIARPA